MQRTTPPYQVDGVHLRPSIDTIWDGFQGLSQSQNHLNWTSFRGYLPVQFSVRMSTSSKYNMNLRAKAGRRFFKKKTLSPFP